MFKVILDVNPATKGHALILPKEHYANIYEIDDEVAGKAFILAKKLAGRMTEVLKCDGFNILQNNGEVAGQTDPFPYAFDSKIYECKEHRYFKMGA
jgi:histidine triad (HIT) family protein